ncbi:xin actin-binding repeat-containing protein 2-like isoform X1, partial [Clarias magur]
METQSGSRDEELKATGHTRAADAKEDLQENRRIERFDIPLTDLKSMFEKPTMQNTEAKGSSLSARSPRSKGSPENQVSNQSDEMSESAGSVGVSVGDLGGEVETVPLKERLALYQAAITKEEKSPASAVMEDSEACSLPGGLASVKKQFESQKVSSSSSSSSQSTVTQYHYQQRQEVTSSSEMSVKSSVRESHNVEMSQDQKTQQSVASSFGNHFDEKVVVIGDQELPQISTHALKQQHEKNIEEATPSKQIKKIRVPDNELCRVCRKRVYPMESLIADKQNFHKTCFRCAHCNSQL